MPEKIADDARAKLLAEAQVLRDAKLWAEANDVLAAANQRFPNDADLLYEQSMMSEKLNRLDEMEQLLRRVIELKPDHHHAYNALGYSLAERNVRLPEAQVADPEGARAAARASRSSPTAWAGSSTAWATATRRCACCAAPTTARPDTEIAAHLGEVLWVTGQRDEARRIWREGAQSRRHQRRAARNAGAAAGRPVTRALRRLALPLAPGAARRVQLAAARARPTATPVRPPVGAGRGRARRDAPRGVGRVRAERQPAHGRLDLTTPLGNVLAQARWAPGTVVLKTPQGDDRFADLDALTREVLGESLPVAALFDWLRGRPWPGAPSSPTRRPTGFEQLGWVVDLARFDEGWVAARACTPPVVTVRARLDR